MDAILMDVQHRLTKIEQMLSVQKPINEIIDIDELCKLTGLERQTVYQLKYEGKIPHFKFGKRLLRFRRSEILKWMENRSE